jgi:hypothetical protein
VNWRQRPNGWPLNVPFVDPNNATKLADSASKSKKPSKEVLHIMHEHLKKQVILSVTSPPDVQ